MNNDHVFIPPAEQSKQDEDLRKKLDELHEARLAQLVAATDRTLVRGTPTPDAITFGSLVELESELRGELEEDADQEPNELDRRPGENRAQHRQRLRAGSNRGKITTTTKVNTP